MTIFLCGFMGCGKTTSGKLAAKKLGCGFYDTDEMIVASEGMSIPEIFAQKGEPYFRRAEAEIVRSLCGRQAVAACGGGALLNPDTAEAIRSSGGAIVFIDADFETCYERICGDTNRPIAAASSKEELLERFDSRRNIYLAHATAVVSNPTTPMETAEEIIRVSK
ncbi:MAG: shikimate kinase [Ruminococcus sp.]|nr:shikimate kinase [Ruminococcus sp.]MBR2282936.1 shikimate kinase [Ruminococcus sp.]